MEFERLMSELEHLRRLERGSKPKTGRKSGRDLVVSLYRGEKVPVPDGSVVVCSKDWADGSRSLLLRGGLVVHEER